jgi:hypothetical protein
MPLPATTEHTRRDSAHNRGGGAPPVAVTGVATDLDGEYTLLENCKREGINLQEYLQDVLTRRLTTPLDRIAQLTPANWAAARKAKAA